MSRQIRADYSQDFLLPPSLEEWVGPEHPARFIRAFVESLDWAALGVEWNAGVEGRPTYGADLLLKVWLYGYFVGLRSTRKLEAACREQMGLLWLAGLNAPDHNTLWRFFERNRAALRALFGQSVRVAVNANLVGLALHALDGSKIQAQCATASGLHLEKLKRKLAHLDEIVGGWEREIESSAAPDEPGTGLPEALHDEARLREEVKKQIAALEEAGHKHLHPGEPEARVMKCSDMNAKRFAYNSQALADADSGILVAQDVSCEQNDLRQLAPMLERVHETLGACAQLTVADTGYAAGEQLARAHAAHHDIAVHLPRAMSGMTQQPYHASHFTYDPEHDVVICPRGQTLPYKHTRHHQRRGQDLRLYRCHNKDCPVRAHCTHERKGRSIELGPYHHAVTHQRERNAKPDAIHALHRRGAIIERVFAHIKQTMNFRRYTLRGLEKTKTQWALICTAYNLQKLYQHWRAPAAPPDPTRHPHSLQPNCQFALAGF